MATVQYFCAVIPLPSYPSDMIIRSLFEQLRWVWAVASVGCDLSSANTAVNYHCTPQQVHHTMLIAHDMFLCVPLLPSQKIL